LFDLSLEDDTENLGPRFKNML